jgi:hypothetical protein
MRKIELAVVGITLLLGSCGTSTPEVTDALRTACPFLTDEQIQTSMIVTDQNRDAGTAQQQMLDDAAQQCQEAIDAAPEGDTSDDEILTYCNQCSSAIINYVYGL